MNNAVDLVLSISIIVLIFIILFLKKMMKENAEDGMTDKEKNEVPESEMKNESTEEKLKDPEKCSEQDDYEEQEILVSIKCIKCGKSISLADKKCPYCGEKLETVMPITEDKLQNDEDENTDEKIKEYGIKEKAPKEATASLAIFCCVCGLIGAVIVVILYLL